MINIKNLKASVDNKEILKGLNLTIGKGEVMQLWDPMGQEKAPYLTFCLAKKDTMLLVKLVLIKKIYLS